MVLFVLLSIGVLLVLAYLLDRLVFRGGGVDPAPRAQWRRSLYRRGRPVGVDGEPEFARPSDEASRL